MAWQNDPLFQAREPDTLKELGAIASPAFRFSGQASLNDAHPLDHVDAYDRLFRVFEPVLRRDAERLMMVEKAGAKARRRSSIKTEDWQPFHHWKNVVEYDDRFWIAFDFKSGRTAQVFDKGPTGFRFRVARSVQIDATVPVETFADGGIDIEALKAVMLSLPVRTALAGYGMATSSYFDGYESPFALLEPAARKFPAIDLCPSPRRSWFSDSDDNIKRNWVSGINWLTLVGEPYLTALGGIEAIARGLPPEIAVSASGDKVLFQLGSHPITGESGRDDALLPLYHALGRKLQPIADGTPSKAFPRGPVFGDPKPDESLRWERRFYDGHWFERTAP